VRYLEERSVQRNGRVEPAGAVLFVNGIDMDCAMAKHPTKHDFPVGEVRRYLEPGPIVLVSSRWKDETNIMTMGWHTVME
jgi:hypothetical protein